MGRFSFPSKIFHVLKLGKIYGGLRYVGELNFCHIFLGGNNHGPKIHRLRTFDLLLGFNEEARGSRKFPFKVAFAPILIEFPSFFNACTPKFIKEQQNVFPQTSIHPALCPFRYRAIQDRIKYRTLIDKVPLYGYVSLRLSCSFYRVVKTLGILHGF